MTLQELLKEGQDILSQAGVPEPELDAWYLLSRAFAVDRVHYFMDKGRSLKEEIHGKALADYHAMIKTRRQRVPLQHILGDQEFMGLVFKVNESVLIPRQDTETLVERVLADYQGRQPFLLDLCTGSGCIAVSLAKLGGFRHVEAADISAEALQVAGENAAQNSCTHIRFIKSDLFDEVNGKFDVIVSNPPYIPTEDIHSLEPEVRIHEPMLALDGSGDGLIFYRRLSAECKHYLRENGRIYLEIGCQQADDVSAFVKAEGFTEIEVLKDAAGLNRVVTAAWK